MFFFFFSGSGIFVLSGQAAARHAGPSIIISYILGGIAALFTALSMSEMSSMMSSSGSVYTYTYVGKFYPFSFSSPSVNILFLYCVF